MKKTLLLINPNDREEWYRAGRGVKEPFFCNPKLALGYIAAMTPNEEWDFILIDEDVESVDYSSMSPDLVAITAVSANAPRSYKIASEFKRRSIPTVMGGYHVTFLPDEPLQNGVTSVVTHEAEGCWSEVLADFNAKQLKPNYRGGRPPITQRIKPRRDLYKSHEYWVPAALETTRGCPYPCNFCCITSFNDGDYRNRDINLVIEEIKELKALGNSNFFFLDDNLLGSKEAHFERFKELFSRVKELGIRWSCQITMNFTYNPELMKLARESGCSTCFIGMESIGPDSLKSMSKGPVIARLREDSPAAIYANVVKRMHDHGLAVCGAFIFGADTDTPEVFEKTADFILEAGIDTCQLNVMTPIIGTEVYATMKKENRLLYNNFPEDWAKWNYFDVVHKPKNLTVEQIKEGIINTYKRIGAPLTVLGRAWRTFTSTGGNIGATGVSYFWTTGFSGSYFRKYGSEYLNRPQCDVKTYFGSKNLVAGGLLFFIGFVLAIGLTLGQAMTGGSLEKFQMAAFFCLTLVGLPLSSIYIGQQLDRTCLSHWHKLYISVLNLACAVLYPLSFFYSFLIGGISLFSKAILLVSLVPFIWLIVGQWRSLNYYNYQN